MSTQINEAAASTSWRRQDYSADNCSLTRGLEVLGDKWTFPIMREAFFGVRRFNDFETALGCARNLLSVRLNALVNEGLLRTQEYKDRGARKRFEYRLTEKGRDLLPVLISLLQWGDRWVCDPNGPPILLEHKGCGGGLFVDVVCQHGHRSMGVHEIEIKAGPGARRADSKK